MSDEAEFIWWAIAIGVLCLIVLAFAHLLLR